MSKGARPLTWQSPTLEIAGRSYTVRRLGLLDIQRAAKIVVSGLDFISRKQLARFGQMDVEERGTFILDFIPHAMDEVIDFTASLIGLAPGVHADALASRRESFDEANAKRQIGGKALVEWQDPNVGTIRDPEVFPAPAIVDVIQALVEHEDVVAFFESVRRLLKAESLKNLKSRLSAQSISSSPATDGKTSTSRESD